MPYDVRIQRLPIFALFDIKGPPAAITCWTTALPPFPETPNTLIRAEGADLCFIGHNRWLLRADLAQETALETRLRPGQAPPDISIVKVSDTQTFFRLTGPDAEQVLSIGCPLDLHASVFGKNAVSFTEFFGLKALVLRCPDGFDVAVDQSFGDMIADCLARAVA